jgi:hypothetical protein
MNRKRNITLITVLSVMAFFWLSGCSSEQSVKHMNGKSLTVKVVDAVTQKPLKGAIVTMNHDALLTDENGNCTIKPDVNKVAVRAYGYLRAEQDIDRKALAPFLKNSVIQIKLTPFIPKALYLSGYGVGSSVIRKSALALSEQGKINALVIDVKGDRGIVPYKSAVKLAADVGAQKIITVKDVKELIKSLKEKGIYTIARIVVFKDNLLGIARPDLTIKTADGTIWKDRENLIWVDPSKREVWDYVISIAVEAAQIGFDEVQFDYVRFPDKKGLAFSIPNTEENRVNAISGFLSEARKQLLPYNVFLSADIFGYVCWNLNDTFIGQKLKDLSLIVDYMSPMLYPSGFQFGIPGYRVPVAHPYEIVYLSLKRSQERTNLPSNRFRPWLQAFRDYAFDRRHFNAKEIREQIDAAEKFGSHGWMLWNPRNVYSSIGSDKNSKE